MSDKINELDEQLNDANLENEKTQEEIDAANGKVSLEQNDNWTFEAEAPTLGDDFAKENFEAEVPVEVAKPVAKPIEKPVEKPKPQPKAEAKAKEKVPVTKSDKIMFTLVALISVIVIALLVFLGVRYYTVPNTDEKMNPGNIAVTVGDTDVSVGMYNYYYTMVVNEYTSGQYEGLDPYSDFSNQFTKDEDGNQISWLDYFEETAIDRIKADVARYNLAVENGATLTKDQKTEINDTIKSLKESASQADKSIDEFLMEQYGDYCGQATIKKLINQLYLAQVYDQKASVELKVTDKELEAYEKEHADDYKSVSVAYLMVIYNTEEKDGAKKALNDAKKYAKQIKTKDDMKLLIPKANKEMIKQYVDAGYYANKEECILDIARNMETSFTLKTEGVPEDISSWAFDESTKKGDVTTIADEQSGVVYVLLKTTDNELSNDTVYSVRHILIAPEAEQNEDGSSKEPTKAQWDAAKKKADDVLAEYNKGDKSEYSFALLAEKYSTDTGSTSAGMQSFGGIYSGVALGTMVKEFESWSVDKARKYGDVDIVKTDFGYHIMFFIENTKKYMFDMQTDALAEKSNNMYNDVECKTRVGLKNTKKAEPLEQQPVADNSNGDGAEVDYSELENAEIEE